MKITMTQEELIHAMNLRPEILTELYLLKEELTYVETTVQRHSPHEIKKAIDGFAKRAAASIKKLQAAGNSIDNFATTHMCK